LALWGGAAAGAVTLFLSPVPIFQVDVLKKIPFVATYFEGAFADRPTRSMSMLIALLCNRQDAGLRQALLIRTTIDVNSIDWADNTT
jgi:ubiquinol-cytochrome c reductase subunit 10